MDIGFLFGWAEEEGVDLPTKADGSINIPVAFALYDEWKKKGGGGKAKDDGGTDSKGGGKETAPDVVELDENSELMKRVEGLKGRARTKAIANYIVDVLGGRSMTLHDGISAVVDNADLIKMAQDAFPHGRGLRRTQNWGK